MRRFSCAAAALIVAASLQAVLYSSQSKPGGAAAPVVVLTTAKGVIEIEMSPEDAPVSVERIVDLAKHAFYRGTRFHWVQPGVAQVGDQLTRDMTKRDIWGTGGSGPQQSLRPIGVAEKCSHRFERGVVGFAYRTGYKPETADSQIFIVKIANPALNGKYAMLGHVIKGMNVVDKIELDDMIKDVAVR
jgi:cyclophilin family peptidyl-prolyl cis-trans isomerase